MSVEESRRRREALMKERGLQSDDVQVDKHAVKEPLKGSSTSTKQQEVPRYKPVNDPAYAQQSFGLYNMMSGNPVLDKIARYWGLHLTQGNNLHLVVSLVLFICVSMLTSTVLGFLTAVVLGVNLFAGLLGLLMFFLVTFPCTTRVIYYGVRFYNKIKYSY